MMFLTEINMLYVWISIAVLLAILVVVCVIFLLKTKRHSKSKIDDQFIQTLLNSLGGKENIVSAHFINGRVNIELNDVELAHLDDLKSLSTAGVFIANNTIKMLFSYDSETICKALSNHS